MTKVNRIIFVLSLIGICIAVYVLQSFLRQASIICLNTGCDLVRKSPNSYMYGIPVPAFGLVGYSFLALLSFLYTIRPQKWILRVMLLISAGGVVFVSWFTYTELFVIKAICTWCAVSGVIMVILLGTTIYFNKGAYEAKR